VARGLNKVILLGILGREPEMRYTPDGKAVTSFSVTTRRVWTTSGGERHESAEWFNLIAWGPLAERCSETLNKGSRVYVEGHLQTRSWIGQDSRRHFRTELAVSDMVPLDWRGRPGEAGDAPASAEGTDRSSHVNKVMIIGTLEREPEMQYTPGGKPVSRFSIAARQSWVTTEGERRETTEWFNVVAWGALAEICGQHLCRGRQVYVEGHLQTHFWAGQEDLRGLRTELVATEMVMLDEAPANSSRATAHEQA
jgi:single-strand DNA-binding protein